MKKIIAILLLMAVSTASFSQSTTTTSQLKTDYLKKSKHQLTTATIILLSGAVLIATPLLVHPKTGGDATMGIVMEPLWPGFFVCLLVSLFLLMPLDTKRRE